jgi:energy-coupling factor transporter ATP-binding protein EcfA2
MMQLYSVSAIFPARQFKRYEMIVDKKKKKKKMDLRLFHDRVMCVAGPSQCGKTSFVMGLLDKRQEIFRKPVHSIMWCYGVVDAERHRVMREKGYQLHFGIPNATDMKPNSICILDDLLSESENSKHVTSMFTRLAHHLPCFIVFISQNLFSGGKESRTRSVNTHYYVIFRNPRDKLQFQTFARQIYPTHSKTLIEVYEDATRNPHGYLFLDFTQECLDEYRFRTNILDTNPIIYRLL